ncbi:Predicted membrane protein [Candidatus Ornithobacterium hominis]|uniref:DUF805 domain-containing protein n=1 Tax=Candidatus Ornithobacterium hominis TaxID=2497989 RepID=UPI000E5B377C|nr:DUF805 domain-containing protein [Candidatus Ornithobacterium hominis]SZD73550.1 Predicted membrane protein [Candidatus Ornithobacterium hominis]
MFEAPFSFNGRIRRTEFGLSLIIYATLATIINLGTEQYVVLNLILLIPLLWFLWAQGAKRCHDLGKNGWWQLIPFYGLWMIFQDGQRGSNQYGEAPKNRTAVENQNAVTQLQPKKEEPTPHPKKLSNFEKAMAYYQGKGLKQSYTEAVFYLKKAVEEGNEEAKNLLASCYYEGKGVEQSYTDAFNLWKEIAEAGNTDAMYNVGLCYYQGNGVEQNKEKAMEYLRTACEQRNDNACNLLNRIKMENNNNQL